VRNTKKIIGSTIFGIFSRFDKLVENLFIGDALSSTLYKTIVHLQCRTLTISIRHSPEAGAARAWWLGGQVA